MGSAPVLEAILYERIPKLRPDTFSEESPLIEKYVGQRKKVKELIDICQQLDETDIVGCPHCPLAVKKTPAFLENSREHFSKLSLSSGCGGSGVDEDIMMDLDEETVDVVEVVKDGILEDGVVSEKAVGEKAVDVVDDGILVSEKAGGKKAGGKKAVGKKAVVIEEATKETVGVKEKTKLSRCGRPVKPPKKWSP